MFYCEECAKRNNYPFEFYLPHSRGPCEICKKTATCVDVPSNRLPNYEPTPDTVLVEPLTDEECDTCRAVLTQDSIGGGRCTSCGSMVLPQKAAPDDDEERRNHLIKAVVKRFDSSDFDDHVHELKSKEASAINNSGPEEQLKYLIEQCGEDWVREVFLPKVDPPEEPDMIEAPKFTMQQEVYELVWRLPDDRFYALCDRLGITPEDVREEIAGWSEPGKDSVTDERVARANIMADKLRIGERS